MPRAARGFLTLPSTPKVVVAPASGLLAVGSGSFFLRGLRVTTVVVDSATPAVDAALLPFPTPPILEASSFSLFCSSFTVRDAPSNSVAGAFNCVGDADGGDERPCEEEVSSARRFVATPDMLVHAGNTTTPPPTNPSPMPIQ